MLSPEAYAELTDNGNLYCLDDELFEHIPGKTSEEQKAHYIKVREYSNGMTDNGDGTWTLHSIESAVAKFGTRPRKWKNETK